VWPPLDIVHLDIVIADQRLCLTEDGCLVAEGDPSARWLYCVPGQEIPRHEAEHYGLCIPEKTPKKPKPKA
jgi:hypothetical protein